MKNAVALAGRLALWLGAAALLHACGGGSGTDSSGAGSDPAAAVSLQTAPAPPPAPLDRGTLLQADWSTYPRLVRLAHQSAAARNGRILASVTERVGGVWQPGFHASDDAGRSFKRIGAIADAAFATGICCGTLFEMPQAVGALPAGTLLYAVSVGHDVAGTLMEQRIHRSDDAGLTFRRVEGAACGRSAVPRGDATVGSGVWEPEFLIAADGSLACIYSDETTPGKSQVLKLTRTSDGTTWSAPRLIVSGPAASDRPGMAEVRRLPSGRYAMTFESCSTARLDCSVRLKLSDDGLDWGAPGSLGVRPQTAGGQFFRHTPTLAWTAAAGQPNGLLLLIGQIVATDRPGIDGSGVTGSGIDGSSNGRVLFVNSSADGSGDWRAVAAPIGLPSPPLRTNWCQNYSTPILPSADGSEVLLMQTDSTADGGCSARFGQGILLAQ